MDSSGYDDEWRSNLLIFKLLYLLFLLFKYEINKLDFILVNIHFISKALIKFSETRNSPFKKISSAEKDVYLHSATIKT